MTDAEITDFIDERIAPFFRDGRERGLSGWVEARCPRPHDGRSERRASFAYSRRTGSYNCQACGIKGVNLKDLCALVGISHPFGTGRNDARPRALVRTYDYCDENGKLLFQTCRYEPKDFRQRQPDGNGGWIYSITNPAVRRVLYRLPELVAADPDALVHLVEGEKDVESLMQIGLVATTNPMGAADSRGNSKWLPEFSEFLRGRAVVLLPDNDGPGRRHMAQRAHELTGIAASVRVLQLPGLPPKGDVSDWIEARGTREQLEALVAATAEWAPSAEPEDDEAATDDDASCGEAETWGDPVDFTAAVAGPSVPLEAFPRPVADYVEAVAATHQIALDMAAGIALGVLAAASAGRAEVQIGPTHKEPLNLYVAPCGESGERKGPALRAFTFPLEEEERRLIEATREDIATATMERAVAEKRFKRLTEQAAREDDPAKRAALKSEAAEVARTMIAVPAAPQLVYDDATPEAVAKALADQGGRAAIVSEEAGSLFEILAGRYTKGIPSLDVHLKAYDGGAIRTNRVGRASVITDQPALTILITPQPVVLDRIAEHADFRGRGLLARFAFVMPRSLVGTRFYQDRPIPPDVRDAYEQAVRTVLARPLGTPASPPELLRITGDALKIWASFADQVEREQAEGGDLVQLRDWASKHAGRVARIAGLFHLIEHPIGSYLVSTETVAAAWAVGEWLQAHAVVAFARMGSTPEERRARHVLRWIRRRKLDRFTLRDLHQAHRAEVDSPEALLTPLRILEERCFVRREAVPPRQGPGRPASPTFTVNPAAFTHNSQTTLNSPETSSEEEL